MTLRSDHVGATEPGAGDVTVVRFQGCEVSLNEETLGRIRHQLFALAGEPAKADVRLDLANVKYLTGGALGVLDSLHDKLRRDGRRLIVDDVSPQIPWTNLSQEGA
ncbi:MAG: STAS domain-containing protein [Gemmataceae bacterium]